MKAKKLLSKVGMLLAAGAMFLAGPSIPVNAEEDGNLPKVDTDHPVTLTVHKYLSTINPSNAGTGLPLNESEGSADIKDFGRKIGTKDGEFVIFSITQLKEATEEDPKGVDATTKTEDVTADIDQGKDNYATKTKYYGKTGADGDIKEWYPEAALVRDQTTNEIVNLDTTQNGGVPAATLAQGFWYLKEEKELKDFQKAAPSIVSLPMGYTEDTTKDATTTYNYNVHVYPKNMDETPITKTVVGDKELAYKEGQDVSWKIAGLLNYDFKKTDEQGQVKYGTYEISDTVDPRLTVNEGKVVVGLSNQKDTLVKDTDYTVAFDDDAATKGKKVTVSLLPAGIDKALSSNSWQLYVTIPTQVNEKAFVGADDDIIENGAQLEFDPDGKGVGEEPTTETVPETDKPYITLAKITINKVNKKGEELAGARFKIALSEADVKAGKFLKNSKGVEIEAESKADGTAVFSGIPFDKIDNDTVTLYLWETASPKGYERSNEITKVTLIKREKDGATGVKYQTFENENPAKIVNYQPGDDEGGKHFNLPLTGGTGSIMFMIAGVGLIGLSALFLLKDKKHAGRR